MEDTATKAAHTPTPWGVWPGLNGEAPIQMITDNALARHIAYMVEGAHAEANAARIVRCVNAHDELLEALKGLVQSINAPVHSYDDASIQAGDTYACIDIARIAIAKAEATP